MAVHTLQYPPPLPPPQPRHRAPAQVSPLLTIPPPFPFRLFGPASSHGEDRTRKSGLEMNQQTWNRKCEVYAVESLAVAEEGGDGRDGGFKDGKGGLQLFPMQGCGGEFCGVDIVVSGSASRVKGRILGRRVRLR